MPDRAAVVRFDTIDSTNLEARRRAEAGETGPLWLTAGVQTAGVGRRGRAWSTPRGNLAATLLLTVSRPPAEAAQVGFVAALAVSDLAASCLPDTAPPDSLTVKWPNDVLLNGRKLAGILVESGTLPAGGLWLAVGMGVNLAEHPVDVERPATSLAAEGVVPPPSPEEALGRLAAAFGHWLRLWEGRGFSPIADAWTARAHGLGRSCIARLPNETVEGVAEGLEPDGALRLRLACGDVRRVTAGDVFFGSGR